MFDSQLLIVIELYYIGSRWDKYSRDFDYKCLNSSRTHYVNIPDPLN